MTFFQTIVNFRIRKEDLKLVKKICRANKKKYDSESHFFRAAVLKLMREERARLKL